jgi:hypothetical protein
MEALTFKRTKPADWGRLGGALFPGLDTERFNIPRTGVIGNSSCPVSDLPDISPSFHFTRLAWEEATSDRFAFGVVLRSSFLLKFFRFIFFLREDFFFLPDLPDFLFFIFDKNRI